MNTDKRHRFPPDIISYAVWLYHSTKPYQNNRAEQSHESTGVRERGMRKFKSAGQAQRFLSTHAVVSNLFNVRRHLVSARHYRNLRVSALAAILEKLAPAATSISERYMLFGEAENLFMQQYAIIPIYSYTGKNLVQPSVGGYYPNAVEYRNFKHLTLDSSKGEWQWPTAD